MAIKLHPEVSEALGQYNLQTTGKGVEATGCVTDPEVIARLESLAIPGEDLNDTIMRVLRGAASSAVN